MGWVEKVKGIIERLKVSGKSKGEIADIVQQAADKATVNKNEERKIHVACEVGEVLVIAKDTPKGTKYFMDEKTCEILLRILHDKKSNNWRRMHGLPMRRKRNRRMRRERGKGTDNHSKNADVS